ncbi:PilS cassette [Neisseria meningitidis serogroup B]|uniref:PilS cassette n=1 Tax=Neisseria meningitidis serogroup B TaxID=491 RepID=A0A0H5QF75_NEIMI|nr:PilS cassette [Neisseria meningitidis serogroup B]
MQVSVWMDSSFPRRRESRSVGTETYRVKRFLEILRPRFPLSWE